ncbi:MAG: PKD domain-containing protein [Bacteroidia bacterium]|nr:PKD domain-containing protein [Bacteroidia bacterium]
MKRLLLLIFLSITTFFAHSQYTNNCATADPFCTGTTYNFPLAYDGSGAGGGPQAQAGPNYTCLLTTPSPVWYFLLIDQSGNIDIHMSSSAGTDIDFTCWGPFSSLTNVCNNLTSGNTVDCSYSTAAQEDCNISNAISGQYYMMLITNFANTTTNVVFSQTNSGAGAGSTNCNVVYCNITGITTFPGACVPGNTFTLTGCVDYNNLPLDHPPTTGNLTVTVNPGGYTQTFTPPFVGTSCFSIAGIPANGAGYSVTGVFSAAPTCTWTSNFTAPAACNACSVNAGVDQSVCGLTATLAATAGQAGYSAYHWNPVAGITFGNINSATSTITAAAAGTYTLTWVGTNSSSVTCTDNMTITFSNPLAGFTYNSNQCLSGNSFNFTNTGTSSGATYSWTFAGGTPATSTAQNPTGVTFSTSGVHAVTQTVTIGTCTATSTQNITVYPQPSVSATPTNVTCFGACNGSAIAAGSAGAAPYTYHWSTGPNTPSISSLCPGTYLVTVTDNLGCTGTNSTTITQPAALVLNATRTNPTCNGACNGTANVTVAGGIGPFSYLWSTLGPTASITGLCVGTYTVTVTDNASAGCTQTASVILTAPAPITLTNSSVPATCGMANGTATVNITSGGVPNYNYVWSSGPPTMGTASTTNTISGLTAGAYTVTVTNSNGCTNTTTVNVGSSGAPTATISASANPICFGQCNGTATVSIGGTLNPPYNYVWSTGSSTMGTIVTTNTASNLCNGNSSVTVTDNLGCSAVASVTVTQPTVVSAITTPIAAHCGNSDGSATITPAGGTPGYTYLWPATAANQNTITAINLAPGTYIATVTDNQSCTTTVSATIGNTAGVVASISGFTNISCFGGANGTATASGVGGNGPYTYLWPPSASSQVSATAINLSAGSYVVTITDANLCTSTATATITAPSVVTANITGFSNALCNSICNGTATVTAGGGTPAYTYLWSNGQVVPNSTGLCNGTYSVTVRDANLCSAVTSVTISQPTVLTASTTTVNAHCGHADGTATVTGAGGTPSYTYLWSGGAQVTQTATNLLPGSYTVTVSDANLCTVIANATVGNTPGGTASISTFTNVSCSGICDGSATVSMGGGTLPYSYNWSSGGVTSVITNLCAGSYIATVSDANGCTSTATAVISSPTPLTVNITIADVSCAGQCTGILTSVPSGGTPPYSNMWSNSFAGSVNNNLCAGSYTVTVTDSHTCSVIGTSSITAVPPIVLSAIPTSANCNQSNGALDLTVTNGAAPFTYIWSPSGSTEDLVNIPAGVYNVTVTDFKGCSQTGSYTVSNIAGPVASIASSTNVTCNGLANGLAQGSVSGGTAPFTYSWSNGQNSITATNLIAGTYTFSATDGVGCVSSVNVTITQLSVLSVLTISSVSPLCNGNCNGSASVLATGGTLPYSYLWVGGTPFGGLNATSSMTTGICSGNLSVLVTDANGCTVGSSTSVVEPTFITLTTSHTDESCSGLNNGTASVSTVGGVPPYQFQWDANAAGQTNDTAIGLAGGIYSVTVTDSHNCTETISVTVGTPNPMVFNSVIPTHLTCYLANDGSISTNVTGGTPSYTYQWTNALGTYSANTQNIGNLPQDTYFLTVTDQNGCNITTSEIISQPPQLNLNLIKTDETCFQFCDGSISANVSGGQIPYTYLWSNILNTSLINNLCPGNYVVTITDNNGCTISSNATVTGNPLLQIDVLNVVPATCGVANGEATIGIQGGLTGYSISWTTGGNSVHETGMPAGIATVTLIDQNGCIATQQIAIQNLAGPQITTLLADSVSCAGMNDGVAIVSYTPSSPAAPPYISSWTNLGGGSFSGDTISGLEGDMYYVTVSDANGCQSSGFINVHEPTAFVSVISNSTNNHCFGNCLGTASVLAGGGILPYTYDWLGISQTGATATNLCAGPYTVVAEDAHGCTSVNVVTITEPPALDITGVVTDAHCYGNADGMISVSASGGTPVYQYNWQLPAVGSSSITSNLIAGTYSVIVTDIWSCTAISSFTVDQPSLIYVYASSNPAHCGFDNGSAQVDSVVGGIPDYTYHWSPGNSTATSITNLISGNYQLQVTDNQGCGGVVNVNVPEIAPPSQLTFNVTNAICPGSFTGSITANVVGGLAPYSYLWSDLQSTQIASGVGAGVYTVTVTDANLCTIANSTIVGQPNPIIVYANGVDSICIGNNSVNITANASGGTPPFTYLWTGSGLGNPSAQTQMVSPDSTTNYFVNAYDANGCISQNPGIVGIYVYPAIYASTSMNTTICEGDNYNIDVTAFGGIGPPYNYVWNIGAGNPNTVTPTDTTTYTVQVFDGCGTPPGTATMTIFVRQAPRLIRDPRYQSGCVPLLANFDAVVSVPANDSVRYNWNFGDPSTGNANLSTDSITSHIYGLPGSYAITLTLSSANYGCEMTRIFNDLVEVYPIPTADFSYSPNVIDALQGEVQFNAETDPANQTVWDLGDGESAAGTLTPTHIYENPGVYTITLFVRTEEGCIDTVQHTLRVNEIYTIWVPTAFYPGTGSADGYFYPKGRGFDKSNYYLAIYDRWGQIIFETTTYPEGTALTPNEVQDMANLNSGWLPGGWNGGFKNNVNKLVPVGTYSWYIKVKDVNGTLHEETGPVTVIR